MSVTTITTDELRQMSGQEGLIIQGCGGDLDEWVEGINDILTEEGILMDGMRMENCKRFTDGNLTCLLFPFDGAKFDMGKLAMWRLKSHETFGGTWLSDYVSYRLGGFIEGTLQKKKPDCPLIGQDGNIFNLVGIASRTLKRNGMAVEAEEMANRVFSSESYHDALNIIGEYVNITSSEQDDCEGMYLRQ